MEFSSIFVFLLFLFIKQKKKVKTNFSDPINHQTKKASLKYFNDALLFKLYKTYSGLSSVGEVASSVGVTASGLTPSGSAPSTTTSTSSS